MYNLTPANVPVINSIVLLFMMGILFFVVAFFVMTFMFAWTYNDVIKHGKKLAVMLLISLSIPFTVGAINQQTNLLSNASSSVSVENLQVQRVEDDTVIVQFTTSAPVIAYLEYQNSEGETVPVLPTGSTDPKSDHYFRVDNFKGEKGELYIVINGNKFTLNGKPISLPE